MVYLIVDPAETRLIYGYRHGAVRFMQEALNRNGAKVAVDGDFGDKTLVAVTRFQMDCERVQGVTGGVAGMQTLQCLGVLNKVAESLARAPPPPPPPQHLDTTEWRAGIGFERINYGQSAIDPNTGKVVAAIGTGWVFSGHQKLVGGRVNNVKGVWLFHGVDDPDRSTIKNNECALFPQCCGAAGSGLELGTNQWRRGPQVRSLRRIAPGTMIATLRDGVYLNDHSGRSHVGIFESFTGPPGKPTGFRMYDQSNGRNIALTTYKFFDKYDPNEIVSKVGSKGDLTIPVYGDNHELLGFTVIEHSYYKNHKFRRIGIGDEYYVVYTNGQTNRVML